MFKANHRGCISPRLRRWSLRVVFCSIVLLIAGYGFFGVLHYLEVRELAQARAEITRRDPGWTWEEIQAVKSPLADDQNMMVRLLEGMNKLPPGWPTWQAAAKAKGTELAEFGAHEFEWTIDELQPNQLLRPDQVDALRAELNEAAAALSVVSKLKDYRTGRRTNELQRPVFVNISGLTTNLNAARGAATALKHYARQQAHDGDIEAALQSCVSALAVSRAEGEPDSLVTYLVQTATRASACHMVHRALAQGETSESALQAAQEHFERDERRRLLYDAARGERALFDDAQRFLDAGKIGPDQFNPLIFGITPPAAPAVTGFKLLDDLLDRLTTRTWTRKDTARVLMLYTEALRGLRLPPEEYKEFFENLDRNTDNAVIKAAFGSILTVYKAELRGIALMRCAKTVIAAERFRKQHQRWPPTVAEMVPSFLAAVPIDPYDGKPLRIGKHAEGIVIYSVFEDRVDDRGDVMQRMDRPQARDIGFQLWDADKRRQPAPPPKPKPKPDDDR